MRGVLSYSRRDRLVVDRVRDALQSAGFDVWVDRDDLVAGDQWRTSIVEGITSSTAVVLLVSPSSMSSENVRREASVASESGRRLVPVSIEPCAVTPEFQYFLTGVQFVDATRERFDQGIGELVADLLAAPSAAPLPPPVVGADASIGAVGPPSAVGRTRRLVGAGVVTVVAVVLGVVLWRGRADDRPAVLSASTLPATAPSATTPSAPSASSIDPSDPSAPGAATGGSSLAYADRKAWIGDPYRLFGIEVRAAELVPIAGVADHRHLRVTAVATNPSNADGPIVGYVAAPFAVVGDERFPLFYDLASTVPGGGSTRFSIGGDVPADLHLEQVVLVWGNAASHRTVVPLDGTTAVGTDEPRVGGLDGRVLDGGYSRVAIRSSTVWANYRDGERDAYWLDLELDSSVVGGSATDNDTLEPRLVLPDGREVAAEPSYLYSYGTSLAPSGPNQLRAGIRFPLTAPVAGPYTLTFASRQAAAGAPGAADPAVSFTLD